MSIASSPLPVRSADGGHGTEPPAGDAFTDFLPSDRELSFVNVGFAAERRDPFRVLVVDDDEHHRRLVSEILAPPDFVVATAADGESGLAQLAESEFDVVLVDKLMPRMSGDRLCQEIRRLYSRNVLPIIMVTGSNGRRDLSTSLDEGANDFIRKPYEPSELVARVQSAASTKRLTDQMESAETLLFGLARIVEAKDECTGDHCSRLSHYAEIFGGALGLGARELAALKSGSILHDIGKIAIPDRVLLKPGPLSAEEWVLMKQHTVIGATLCSELKSLRAAVPIIRHHHERWDGTGYPDGLAGNRIPELAQMFQLLDVFDALTTARPYKPAWSVERAREIIEAEMLKGYYNPDLTRQFLRLLEQRADDLTAVGRSRPDPGQRVYARLLEHGVGVPA